MSARATSGDREQQKHDNNVSRRQSGLEPRPEDREEPRKHAGRGNEVQKESDRAEQGERTDRDQ